MVILNIVVNGKSVQIAITRGDLAKFVLLGEGVS